jgi:hypothetical protein
VQYYLNSRKISLYCDIESGILSFRIHLCCIRINMNSHQILSTLCRSIRYNPHHYKTHTLPIGKSPLKYSEGRLVPKLRESLCITPSSRLNVSDSASGKKIVSIAPDRGDSLVLCTGGEPNEMGNIPAQWESMLPSLYLQGSIQLATIYYRCTTYEPCPN